MKIFHDLDEWCNFRRTITSSLGFVPTMGNLHAGHASLMALSKAENDVTAVSIFINPTQFNQVQDFESYPRTLEADLQLLKDHGVDYCILPTKESIYHDNFCYSLTETERSLIMEGAHRPGHFNGVLTIVMKLLNLLKPRVAYFGEKDYQQYQLIQGMVQSFFMDITITLGSTLREASGLAYSSRNNRLQPEERCLADKFAAIFHQDKPCKKLVNELENEGIIVEYVIDYEARRYAAVVIGTVRLIDNYSLPTI
jgi:pantoate--beta-alanine ligase